MKSITLEQYLDLTVMSEGDSLNRLVSLLYQSRMYDGLSSIKKEAEIRGLILEVAEKEAKSWFETRGYVTAPHAYGFYGVLNTVGDRKIQSIVHCSFNQPWGKTDTPLPLSQTCITVFGDPTEVNFVMDHLVSLFDKKVQS